MWVPLYKYTWGLWKDGGTDPLPQIKAGVDRSYKGTPVINHFGSNY